LLRVGLTGGIAAGKSSVGAMLVKLGARLVQADAISHQLLQPGQAIYDQVVSHFGAQILEADRTINRARLAEAAFADGRIRELNRIIHPAVIKKQEAWMDEVERSDARAIAVVEAALIIEAGAAQQFERLIVVTCRPEQRVERWAARMKVEREVAEREVARRMAAQLPDTEKIKLADYVIDNSGSLAETERQVRVIYDELRAGMVKAEAQGGEEKP